MTPHVDILLQRSRNTLLESNQLNSPSPSPSATSVNQSTRPASVSSTDRRLRRTDHGPYVRQLLAHLGLCREASAANNAADASSASTANQALRQSAVALMGSSCLMKDQMVLPWIIGTNGKYILSEAVPNEMDWFLGRNIENDQRVLCKIIPSGSPRSLDLLWAHSRVQHISSINRLIDVIRVNAPPLPVTTKSETSEASDPSPGVQMLDCYFYRVIDHPRLQEYIQSKAHLTEGEARGFFKQLVNLVTSCHQAGIFLKDMKLRRVYINPDSDRDQITLMSLDNCRILPSDILSNNPSQRNSASAARNIDPFKGDIWALGVILFAMVAGRYPFYDTDLRRLVHKVNTGNYGPLPESFSPALKNLIRRLLNVKPMERPNCVDIMVHPWMMMNSNDTVYQTSDSADDALDFDGTRAVPGFDEL